MEKILTQVSFFFVLYVKKSSGGGKKVAIPGGTDGTRDYDGPGGRRGLRDRAGG